MRVVLVTGSRGWTDARTIRDALAAEEPDLVVAGGARGADSIAEREARGLGVHVARVEALWPKLGAGHARNHAMVCLARVLARGGARVTVLAFMDLRNPTPGTSDCLRRARRAELRTRLIEPA